MNRRGFAGNPQGYTINSAGGVVITTAGGVGWQINSNGVIQTLGANQLNLNVSQTYAQSVQLSGSLTFASGFAGTNDYGITRIASTVGRVSDGGAGLGWLQTDGKKRVAANATNATATMAALTDLSVPVLAGRKYTGFLSLFANNSAAAEGLAIDFNGGTATMTNFQATFTTTPVGATLGTSNTTALGTPVTATVVLSTDVCYEINVTFVVNAAGTFMPRFSEVSHTTGTATVKLGSFLWLEDTP